MQDRDMASMPPHDGGVTSSGDGATSAENGLHDPHACAQFDIIQIAIFCRFPQPFRLALRFRGGSLGGFDGLAGGFPLGWRDVG